MNSFNHKTEALIIFLLGVAVSLTSLFSLTADASQPFGGKYYPKKGQCIMSYPLKMTIVAKGKKNVYMAISTVPVVNSMAAITITSHTPFEQQILNTSIEYVDSHETVAPNGYPTTVDVWRECKLSPDDVKKNTRNQAIGMDELKRYNHANSPTQ